MLLVKILQRGVARLSTRFLSIFLALLVASMPLACFLCAPTQAFASTPKKHDCCPESSPAKKAPPSDPCDGCPFAYTSLKYGVVSQLPSVPSPVVVYVSPSILLSTMLADLIGSERIRVPIAAHFVSPPGTSLTLLLGRLLI